MSWHHERARANLLAADRLLDMVRCYSPVLTMLDKSQRRAVVDLCYEAESLINQAIRIVDGAPPPRRRFIPRR